MTGTDGSDEGGAAPRAFGVTEHLWIPMPDGIRLAARLWLPEGAETDPVPALLEYIPYRKTDMVRARDERNHPFLAAHGYACLRVDMRGSGDSEGHMPDMYAENELSDARHVIDWIAAQPWCSGAVGMFGTSWGGTAALQANVDAPDALKAVIAVCATHDRYEDDIHHMGGCLLTDTFEWGATLPAILGAPPTPNVGPDWMARWRERLEALTFPVEAWVRQEARGTYWRHGSVIHQADRLSRPILAVGGWSDRYSNSVMSLVSARPDLVWGIVGPWGHHYPDQGQPGPAIGFQTLALDWFDRWLKPEASAPDWPRLRVWLREFEPPRDVIETRVGRWIESGPVEVCTSLRTLHLTTEGLGGTPAATGGGWRVPLDLRVGGAAGDTGYFGRRGGLPLDQREDDALSLCFETPPLTEDVVLYGGATLRLEVEAAEPKSQLAVRLNDVAPDGTSALVALSLRNLALDDALDAPPHPDMAPVREVTLRFPTTAYLFRMGHRIRVAVSASCWPIAWPSPTDATACVLRGELNLPVSKELPAPLCKAFPPAIDLPAIKTHRVLQHQDIKRTQSEASSILTMAWHQPFSEVLYAETQTTFGYETRCEHHLSADDPSTAESRFNHRAVYRRPDGTAEMRSTLIATCDRTQFRITGSLSATWQGKLVKIRAWNVSVGRRSS